MTDREQLAAMAQALVRDGVLKRRRGGWYEVLINVHLLPEPARRQVTEIQQITRHTGDTILARTVLIKFRRGVREGGRPSRARRTTRVH
jgi:hypothetical protein